MSGSPDQLAAAQAGDADALDALLRSHYDQVHLLCRRMMADRDEADDATQEALIAIARGIRRFDGRSALSTWVHRVATNACIDEIRKRARRPIPTDPHDDARSPMAATDVGGAEPDGADGIVDRDEIDRALGALPLDFRHAVVLRDVLGYDYAEIAALLEIADGTVRSRISRGRQRLTELLAEPGNQSGGGHVESVNHPESVSEELP